MSPRYRKDLERALDEFVSARRGLRLGRMFGAPAGFAGRRMFACAIDDGLAVRLPPEAVRRERVRGVRPFAPGGRASRGWLFYRSARTGLERGLVRVLEEAAAFAAARSVDEAIVRRTPK